MIWILFIGTLALSLWATWRVKSVYNRYNQGEVLSGLTGAEAAAEILRRSDIRDVEITHADGMLGDHYDPLHKRLVLSEANYFARKPVFAQPRIASPLTISYRVANFHVSAVPKSL